MIPAILLITFVGLLFVWTSITGRHIFSPNVIYLSSQFLTLGIALTKLNSKMGDLSLLTWLVVLGSAVAFLFGSFSSRLGYQTVSNQPLSPTSPDFPLLQQAGLRYNWHWHLFFAVTAFLLFFAGAVVLYFHLGGFMALHPKISRLMMVDGFPTLGPVSYLFSSGPFAAILFATLSFKNINPHKKIRIFSMIMAGITTVLAFLTLPNRISLFVIVIFAVLLFHFVSKRLGLGFILVGLFSLYLVFILASEVRGQMHQGAATDFSKTTLTIPYAYLANNWWNLEFALVPPSPDKEHPPTYGLTTLSGLMRIVSPGFSTIMKSNDWDSIMNERAPKYRALNTFSYQWFLYKDFGMWGVLIVPFLGGLFLGHLYNTLRATGKTAYLLLYAYFATLLSLSFYQPFWTNPLFVIWTVYFIVVFVLCSSRDFLKKRPDRFALTGDDGDINDR